MHLPAVVLLEVHFKNAYKMRSNRKLGEAFRELAPFAQKLEI